MLKKKIAFHYIIFFKLQLMNQTKKISKTQKATNKQFKKNKKLHRLILFLKIELIRKKIVYIILFVFPSAIQAACLNMDANLVEIDKWEENTFLQILSRNFIKGTIYFCRVKNICLKTIYQKNQLY